MIAKVTDVGQHAGASSPSAASSFGYNNLVVDPRAFPMLRALGYPVVFDVTHSLQLPGAGDGVTAGLAEYIEPMAQAGVAAGVDGVFMEVHEEPSRAKSDAANALRLDRLEPLLRRLVALDKIVQAMPDLSLARKVLQTEAAAVLALVDRLDDRFARSGDADPRAARAASSSPAWASPASSAARSRPRWRAPARRRSSCIRPKRCTAISA